MATILSPECVHWLDVHHGVITTAELARKMEEVSRRA